jgi:hypothetical protein
MPGVQGATYCVPIWGKYYEMVFGSQTVADFKQPSVMPVFHTFTGHYASLAPAPAPSPSATAPSSSPTPSPAKTTPTAPKTTAPAPTAQPTGTPAP